MRPHVCNGTFLWASAGPGRASGVNAQAESPLTQQWVSVRCGVTHLLCGWYKLQASTEWVCAPTRGQSRKGLCGGLHSPPVSRCPRRGHRAQAESEKGPAFTGRTATLLSGNWFLMTLIFPSVFCLFYTKKSAPSLQSGAGGSGSLCQETVPCLSWWEGRGHPIKGIMDSPLPYTRHGSIGLSCCHYAVTREVYCLRAPEWLSR